jgi:ubiquinone/menaquinone biosynthesis C-methylase UbiE
MRNKHRGNYSAQASIFPNSISEVYTSVAPYVPTPLSIVRRMLELAELKPGETIFDLGCGDGRIVLMAAKEFRAKGHGVELIGQLVNMANRKAMALGLLDDVEFIRGNLFDVDLSSADVVTMYLMRSAMEKVRVKLEEELKPGARVVVLDYSIANWKPDDVLKIDDETRKHIIYLYVWKP